MDSLQLFTLSLGVALALLGWVLTAGNWAIWNAPRKKFKSQEEETLIQGRLGRRLHMSIALVGLGLAISLGAFLSREKATAFYWYGVVALALWMSILAIIDGSATWSYVIRVRRALARKRNAIVSEIASRASAKRLENSDTLTDDQTN